MCPLDASIQLSAWHVQIFRRVGWAAGRLLLIPGICEAFFDGGIAIPIFGMPPTFAFALGFILKAVGPALVIQSMFEVQQKRLGTVKCTPNALHNANDVRMKSASMFRWSETMGRCLS